MFKAMQIAENILVLNINIFILTNNNVTNLTKQI